MKIYTKSCLITVFFYNCIAVDRLTGGEGGSGRAPRARCFFTHSASLAGSYVFTHNTEY